MHSCLSISSQLLLTCPVQVTAHIAIPGRGADKALGYPLVTAHSLANDVSSPAPPVEAGSLEDLVPIAREPLVNRALRRMRSFYEFERSQVRAIKPAERVQVSRALCVVFSANVEYAQLSFEVQ